MTGVADVVRAIRAEGSTSWQIADTVAALDEIDPETGRPLTLAQVSKQIWDEDGTEWNPVTLGRYRATALAFPMGTRVPTHSFRAHMVLRAHPDKLLAWKPRSQGDRLTVERARALRGAASTSTSRPDAWRGELKRAFGTIARLAEKDPAFVLDMLGQTVDAIHRAHAGQLKKAGRDLRAV